MERAFNRISPTPGGSPEQREAVCGATEGACGATALWLGGVVVVF